MSKSKSKAKAVGLKSALIIDDKVLVTSFGKNNDAVPEKEIIGENVKNIEENFLLAVDSNKGAKFKIENNKHTVKTECNNPKYAVQSDLLHAKDKIEMYFWGKTFPNDNIHIQIAYNILDIKKILSLYANNIIFSLNNLRHKEENKSEKDFIGMLQTRHTYAKLQENCSKCECQKDCDYKLHKNDKDECKSYKKFNNYLKEIDPYLSYFSEAFYEDIPEKNSKENDKAKRRSEKDIYNIIRTLSLVRQSCFHDEKNTRSAVFNIEDSEIKELLDRLYRKKIESVNSGFIKNNGKNLSILADIYNKKTYDEKAELTADFYNYIILKENKNLGFNLKTVRETLINKYFEDIKNKTFDSVRHKLYILIDYILYRYYSENEEIKKSFVEELRSNCDEKKDTIQKESVKEPCYDYETKKRGIYEKYAAEINSEVKDKIISLKAKITPSKISEEKKMDINKEWIKNVQLKDSKNYFPKVIWLITLFLDGKEINELLSALINKFENIQSFIEILRHEKLDRSFYNEYKMFENSGEIANELKAVKSFSRMQGEIANPTKPALHADAARILGLKADYTDKELIEYIKTVYHTEENKDKKPKDKDNNMRNFIVNNVIKSNRFLYLVRYNNPKRSRKLASNKKLVEFVLNGISKDPSGMSEIINRYYDSVIVGKDGEPQTIEEAKKISNDKKISKLTDEIANMNFEKFEDVRQDVKPKTSKPKNNSKEAKEEAKKKERYKAVIGLYLTVLYLITKNLVKINARYTIAISCLERDTQFFGINISGKRHYITLADKFIKEKYINDKGGHIKKSMQYAVNDVYREYRNMIAHLEAITFAYKYVSSYNENICAGKITSYYQLYHTILQLRLSERLSEDPKKDLKDLLEELEEKAEAEKEAKEMKPPNTQEEYKGIWHQLYMAVKKGSYSKNLVCILNTPFAYNLARYKNLSLEYFFDKDRETLSDNNETNKN